KHDDCLHSVLVRGLLIPTCRQCGEQTFSGTEEDSILAALRAHLKLLTPAEIQARRLQLGLDQVEFAKRIGVEEETIGRWETGAMIQSRAMDNLLRLFFDCPHARDLLLSLK